MHPFTLVDRSPITDGDADADVDTAPDGGDGDAVFASVSTLELGLWLVVLAALVLDIATTAYGLSIGLVERNPFVRWALDSVGLAALPVLKLGAVAVALACRRAWPACAIVVPLGLAIPWSLAVGINLALILSV